MAEVMQATGELCPPQGQSSMDASVSPIGYMPSAPNAGGILFDPELVPSQFQFDSFVVDRRDYREPREFRQGHMSYESYLMSDGFHYHVLTGIPRKQRTSIPVDMGTAWTTDPEGHNEHTGLRFMEMGLPVRIISGERLRIPRILTPWNIASILRKLASIELARSAHNKLQILHVSDLANRYTIAPNVSFGYGESRDAMIKPGEQFLATTAIDEALRRNYIYTENIDPGCHDKVDVTKPTREQVERLWAEAKAGKEVGIRILKSSLRRHYPRTLDFSLNSVLPQIATAPTILSGQAGELAQHAPDTPRSITLFLMSIASMGEGYRNTYKDRDQTRIFDVDGAHINIPDVLQFVVPSLTIVRDHLEKHGDDPSGIDFEQVWAAKQEAIDAVKAI